MSSLLLSSSPRGGDARADRASARQPGRRGTPLGAAGEPSSATCSRGRAPSRVDGQDLDLHEACPGGVVPHGARADHGAGAGRIAVHEANSQAMQDREAVVEPFELVAWWSEAFGDPLVCDDHAAALGEAAT